MVVWWKEGDGRMGGGVGIEVGRSKWGVGVLEGKEGKMMGKGEGGGEWGWGWVEGRGWWMGGGLGWKVVRDE